MTNKTYVMRIEEIEAGERSLRIQKIAPQSETEVRAEAQMGIRENNPMSMHVLGEEEARTLELQDMLSMDVVNQIFLERERVYRVVMNSGAQYRIWVQKNA